MPEMIQKPNQYRYVGLNSNGELEFKVDSRSNDKTYTITVSIIHDDSISNVPTIQIKHKDKDECEGYKHRENCWHINDLKAKLPTATDMLFLIQNHANIYKTHKIIGTNDKNNTKHEGEL